jgi:hypothetical protein
MISSIDIPKIYSQAIFHYYNHRQHHNIDNLTPSLTHQMNGYVKRQWKTNYKNINCYSEA